MSQDKSKPTPSPSTGSGDKTHGTGRKISVESIEICEHNQRPVVVNTIPPPPNPNKGGDGKKGGK
jgi:hypothetical protein